MNNLIVTTESGTVYEFNENTTPPQVRRVGDGVMRRDGDWLRLVRMPNIWIGHPLSMYIEPLAENAVITLRETTPVVSVKEA